VLAEVASTTSVLRQIQTLLDDQLQIPAERRSLVLLEHVATALTGCIMAKDELETILDGLGLVYANFSVTGIFDRAKWMRKEDDIQKLVLRLQNHKSLLGLVFDVLHCRSTVQIQGSVDRLGALVEEVLSNNAELSAKLSRMGGSAVTIRDEPGPSSRRQPYLESPLGDENDGNDEDDDAATIRTPPGAPSSQIERLSSTISDLSFGEVLEESKVYRRLLLLRSDTHYETSATSSYRRGAAASIFSATSLADISNISQYSLPIFVEEISNSQWYIHVGRLTLSMTSFNIGKPHIRAIVSPPFQGPDSEASFHPTDTVLEVKERLYRKQAHLNDAVLFYKDSGGVDWHLLDDGKPFHAQGFTPPYGTIVSEHRRWRGTIQMAVRYNTWLSHEHGMLNHDLRRARFLRQRPGSAPGANSIFQVVAHVLPRDHGTEVMPDWYVGPFSYMWRTCTEKAHPRG